MDLDVGVDLVVVMGLDLVMTRNLAWKSFESNWT